VFSVAVIVLFSKQLNTKVDEIFGMAKTPSQNYSHRTKRNKSEVKKIAEKEFFLYIYTIDLT
jgi:hypothetical protein